MRVLTYLLTGGAGFIGSHLTDALLDRGDTVVVLDDLSTGDRGNLARAWPQRGLRFVRGSVLDARLVDELTGRCDVVVHLAAAVGTRLAARPLESFTAGVRGTETVVGAALRHGRRLLLASTSEIYGKNGAGPLAETDDRILGQTTVARWSHSTAKAVDEILALGHHHEHGLPVTVARLFNTAGPRQTPRSGAVVPTFAAQALAGQPLTVHGDGTQRRCLAHVADVVDALLLLLDHPGAVGEVVNVGCGEPTAVADLAGLVVERAGSPSPLRFVPHERGAPGDEDPIRVPDTRKLRALTGWQPRRTLDDLVDAALADAAARTAATSLATPLVAPAGV
ncbi:NAD-dependent epimerase/dehydratase family protein [Streptomyces sp. SID5785]|uniref:NAD-dependent epimerase/dehydratase family protein n=1 Tax=Streptomyces sp. SID5785 TaxID=2690309 RepID=UPI0013619F67|nr:NAD-dependent epimerase/dehydratase family protein [Streptomyces sp. SID5785]MZD07062.1 NAD-dependent epimerase/dehydratase family protein [Streptomyces sp. SID5785]